MTKRDIPTCFPEAQATLGTRHERRIGRTGWLLDLGDDIVLKLHNTIIVRYHRDGTFTINTGGWNTVTTKSWINKVLLPNNFRVYTNRGILSILRFGERPDGSFGPSAVRVFDRPLKLTVAPNSWEVA